MDYLFADKLSFIKAYAMFSASEFSLLLCEEN